MAALLYRHCSVRGCRAPRVSNTGGLKYTGPSTRSPWSSRALPFEAGFPSGKSMPSPRGADVAGSRLARSATAQPLRPLRCEGGAPLAVVSAPFSLPHQRPAKRLGGAYETLPVFISCVMKHGMFIRWPGKEPSQWRKLRTRLTILRSPRRT